MSKTKLTELQERVAITTAAFPGMSKAEIARRAGCSRRAVIEHFKNPLFMDRVRELQKQSVADEIELVASMNILERAEVLKRLKQQRGTYLPELQELEDALKEKVDAAARSELVDYAVRELMNIANDFSGPSLSLEDLDRMIADRVSVLVTAGVDISASNPEFHAPAPELYLPGFEPDDWEIDLDDHGEDERPEGGEEELDDE